MVLGKNLIQLFFEISEKFSKKTRIILNLVYIKLFHDFCQSFHHFTCFVKL